MTLYIFPVESLYFCIGGILMFTANYWILSCITLLSTDFHQTQMPHDISERKTNFVAPPHDLGLIQNVMIQK